MILEGEMEIDRLREQHAACEAKENKLKKDLQKAIGHNLNHQARQIEQKIVETKSTIKSTQIEISERTHENEGVKVIKLKEGLLKLSDSYIELAQKSSMIFDGKRNIAGGLPELEQTRGMHDVRYRGSQLAKQTVTRVKESVKTYKSTTSSHLQPEAPPGPLDCPPPYTTIPGPAYPPSYQNTVGCVTYPNGWSSNTHHGYVWLWLCRRRRAEEQVVGVVERQRALSSGLILSLIWLGCHGCTIEIVALRSERLDCLNGSNSSLLLPLLMHGAHCDQPGLFVKSEYTQPNGHPPTATGPVQPSPNRSQWAVGAVLNANEDIEATVRLCSHRCEIDRIQRKFGSNSLSLQSPKMAPPPNGGPGYYDVPEEDYEQDIAGAIGGARI
ncbi:hypothetical protein J6590_026146 [Homalodisca vitripennis]|nr:hypothetical protein J6590_026146 [Homalodisca vitripennis]